MFMIFNFHEMQYVCNLLHFQSHVGSIPQLCLVLGPLVVGLASQNIVISSALTRTVEDVDTGMYKYTEMKN